MLVTPLQNSGCECWPLPWVVLPNTEGTAYYLCLCSPEDSAPDQISPLLNTVVINTTMTET